MNKLLTVLLCLLSTFLISVVPKSCIAQDLKLGQQVFSVHCSVCHADGKNAVMPDKTLEINVLKQNGMYSADAIKTQVKNGKNAMPAFGGRLEDIDIESVAEYVLDQSEQGW